MIETFDEFVKLLDEFLVNLEPQEGTSEKSLSEGWTKLRPQIVMALDAITSKPQEAIFFTVEYLKAARHLEIETGFAEGERKAELTKLEGNISSRKTAIISNAYAEGKITGKNENQRKAEEHQLTLDDQQLIEYENDAYNLRKELVQYSLDYEDAKVHRRYFEDLLSAQRAVINFIAATTVIDE